MTELANPDHRHEAGPTDGVVPIRAATSATVEASADCSPAGSAPESEGCWRKLEPDFTQACPNNAAGGIRIKLFPAESVQKRYGKRALLALVLDLPVCGACAARMTSTEVINQLEPGLWGTFSKEAQRRNRGFLPIKEESQIEFVPFDDPEYVLLRMQMAKTANDAALKK